MSFDKETKVHLGRVLRVAVVVDRLLSSQLRRVEAHLRTIRAYMLPNSHLERNFFSGQTSNDVGAHHPLLGLLDLVALPPVSSLQLKVGHPGGR